MPLLRRVRFRRSLCFVSSLSLAACSPDPGQTGTDAHSTDATDVAHDTVDAQTPVDSAIIDAISPTDAAPADSGTTPPRAMGVTVQSPFDSSYTAYDLGVPDGLDSYITAGCVIDRNDHDTMYVFQASENGLARIQAVGLMRGSDGHILALRGSVRQVATATFNLFGNAAVAQGGLVLFAGSPARVDQWQPASTAPVTETDITALSASGPDGFPQSVAVVPAGLPGAGELRFLYSGGAFTHVDSIYASGQYTFSAVRAVAQINNGAIGFVPTGSPQFTRPSLLVGSDGVDVYDLDAQADPVPTSSRPFLRGTGLTWGMDFDPVTGDFLFTNVQRHVIVVWGFAIPG